MSPSESERHHRFLRAFTGQEPAIRAYVRRLLPSRADADDVMQEVSVVLWEKFASFQIDGDFRAWAFGVARYEVLAWLRDKGRDKLVLDEAVVTQLADESAEREPQLERQREALESCMQKVAPDQRDLLMQAYQPQARMQKVAQSSGRTITGFYQWLHRMRRTLMDCIRRALAQEASS
jgi:RNA polymerase sigma-70 factor (ECF subfamily)